MPHDITYMCNLKNTKKTVNIIKQKQNKTKKQTHRYREQTRGYQWREEIGEGQYRCRGLKGMS